MLLTKKFALYVDNNDESIRLVIDILLHQGSLEEKQ